MVTQISAEIVYWYFLNQPFLFIDMSCESLCYRDEAGHFIPTDIARSELRSTPEYKKQLDAIQNKTRIQNQSKTGEKNVRLRGGNTKKRHTTKKIKTQKKQRKIKTHKYKHKNIENKKIKQSNYFL